MIVSNLLIELRRCRHKFILQAFSQNLVGKPNSYLVFQFILISSVGLHNMHVFNALNYIRNVNNVLRIPNTKKTFFSSF